MSTIPLVVLCAASVFALTLLMNIVRKNTTLVHLYLLQSLALAVALTSMSFVEGSSGLLYAAALTLAVKVVLAPAFFLRLIRKYEAHFSAASYINTPLSLLALTAITVFSYAFLYPQISGYVRSPSIPLLFAAIFGTLFLMVNRRGALAAIIGILSLENAVVLLAASLGIEHAFALELAVAFDIAVWVAIAAGFLGMMQRQFGAIDSAPLAMTHLTEE